MRRFLTLTSACTLVLLATVARAQQLDITAGGSTLFSSKPSSASAVFPPPQENGGVYPTVGAEFLLENRFGFQAEGTFRYKQGLYDGYQKFRPFLYDVNGVFAPRITKKITVDFLAGVGVESLIFYNQYNACSPPNTVCQTSLNSSHFLVHIGGGPRYYFWHDFFVRPEVHYYRIFHNVEFSSDNVVRVGATIGYTFGTR